MKRPTQIILAFVIPLVILISFHLIYSQKEKHDEHKTCVYMNNSLCVVNKDDSDGLKNINLMNYKIDTSNLKQGQDVNYETKSIKSQIITNYLIVITICLILGIVIAFPQIIIFIIEIFGAAF